MTAFLPHPIDPPILGGLANASEHGQITRAFDAAVRQSFLEERRTTVEASQIRERVQRCVRIFKILRGDMNWGLARTLAHIPRYLQMELRGQAWEPDKRRCWIPGDGN